MGLITITGLPIEQNANDLVGNEPLIIFNGGETRQIALSSIGGGSGSGANLQNTENTNSFIAAGCTNKMDRSSESIMLGGQDSRMGLQPDITDGNCLAANNLMINAKFTTLSGGTSNSVINSINGFLSGGERNLLLHATTSEIKPPIGSITGSHGCQVIIGALNSCIFSYGQNTILGGDQNFIGKETGLFAGNCFNKNNSIINGYNNNIVDNGNSLITNSKNSILSGRGVYNNIFGAYRSCIINPNNEEGFSFTTGQYFVNIKGGNRNCVTGSSYSDITNGRYNCILNGSNKFSSILNGCNNRSLSSYSFIAAGSGNEVRAENSSIIGGKNNRVLQTHCDSSLIGSNIVSVSGNMLHANTLYLSADALPTADPGVKGVVFLSGGVLDGGLGASVLMISNG